jgi:2-dehydropantoate 2-reductase
MNFAVLGPGGVGAFLAAALSRAGQEVTVVARERTAQELLRNGIEVESVWLGPFSAEPRVVPALTEDVDVLFVATKATTLPEALERIHAQPRLVVPLLNGLEHISLLRERFGAERVPSSSAPSWKTRAGTPLTPPTRL